MASAQDTNALRRVESGQPVIDWNQILLSIVNTPGAQPANIQSTRNFAIVHTAIYDAVNAIDRTHEPYLVDIRAPRDASETAAADAAAHTALVGLYPSQQSVLDADYASELAKVAAGSARDQGVKLGEQVATDLLAIRANDGSKNSKFPGCQATKIPNQSASATRPPINFSSTFMGRSWPLFGRPIVLDSNWTNRIGP
jgi:hypothetical protein